MIVNGKEYPFWGQFVEQKARFIGGVLEDLDDDPMIVNDGSTTIITDILLEPNGKDSAYFRVTGREYECGFDVSVGRIGGRGEPGWVTLTGYGGHTWRFKEPSK